MENQNFLFFSASADSLAIFVFRKVKAKNIILIII